jgi:hypothetical protein
MKINNKYTKDFLEPIIKQSLCWKDVFNHLGIINGGGNYKLIKKYVNKFNIDTSHFLSKSEIIKHRKVNYKLTDKELLTKNCPHSRGVVKSYIIQNGLIEYKCKICGIDEWRGEKLVLILDHINGVNNDNRLENLQLVCPNCNSNLDTHCGKNTSKSLSNERDAKNLILDKKLPQFQLENVIEKIKESEIDFTQRGWRISVGKLIERTPQYSGKFIKKYLPEIWEICWKHIK